MEKGILLMVGSVGVGGLGIGGLVAFKPWQSNLQKKPKIVTSIKEKYPIALLSITGDESIWDRKYNILEKYSPYNKILKNASSKRKNSNPNRDEIQKLLKSGCEEIYSTDAKDTSNFSDFKFLCSKTNEDATKTEKSWISENPIEFGTDEWDTTLTSLKNHDISKKWKLDNTLLALKEEIKNDPSTFPRGRKVKLQNWCNSIKKEIFKGEESLEFKSQEEFCKKK